MSRVMDDAMKYFGVENSESLSHYGRSVVDGAPGRGSGRYPLGSGKTPNQHGSGDLYSRMNEMQRTMSWDEIAKELGYKNASEAKSRYAIAAQDRRAANHARALALVADGKSQSEAAREMGVSESTFRGYLKENENPTMDARATADFLRAQVEEKGMIDVGTGVDRELGISAEKLNQALIILQDEGYPVWGGGVPQATNKGKQTILKVLCPPGTEHKEIYNFDQIHSIEDYRIRKNETTGEDVVSKTTLYPVSVDGKRVLVRLADDVCPDGHLSKERDGIIEIRPGVPDLDLGDSNYAQVRILVDDAKYLKGMALYSTDIPEGYDIVFNTSKTDMAKTLKPIKDDPENPFGALIKPNGQYLYSDPETGETKQGAINKTREEGDWGEWGNRVPSQFLAKQDQKLVENQLKLSKEEYDAEFDDIISLTNPAVKRAMLEDYANSCDAESVHLQAASFPRQSYQVILPVPSLKDNEVFAPNYKDGEQVALVRFPHGHLSEIPILTVNNKNQDALHSIGADAQDAIGINSATAGRMSGADYDGDTVLVIPCKSKLNPNAPEIRNKEPIPGLADFDDRAEYGATRTETVTKLKKVKHKDGSVTEEEVTEVHYYRGDKEFRPLTKASHQKEMGSVSNLIMDMTIQGAEDEELARAVKHSMCVVDAEKHKLDYRACEIDCGIPELRRKYQHHVDEDGKAHDGGASTLVTRAKSPVEIQKRRGAPKIDPETGELIYKTVEEHFIDPKTGKDRVRTQKSTQMDETKDAYSLSTGTWQENAYADYANHLKARANDARKEIVRLPKMEVNQKARETYRTTYDDMLSELNDCLKNAPRERQAQLAASTAVKEAKKRNVDLTTKEEKKVAQRALSKGRAENNAARMTIEITPSRWEAIQSGAFSDNQLRQILRFADKGTLRDYATPKSSKTITPAKESRIRTLHSNGYTNDEIADALGVSTSTVRKYIKGGKEA